MIYEILKFEIQYRAKRPDTYIFFAIIFLCSIFSFDFILEGVSLGQVKINAPIVIARTMAIVSGFFMIMTSMIMGVPILRDFEYNMESLLFVNPIKKRDYLLGRFIGSFIVLLFINSGLLLGVMLGEFLPWREADSLLPFHFWYYFKAFLMVVLPTLFYSGSIFFVSGMLSRNLIIVYTQGVFFFVIFMLSRSIENPLLSAIIEPFSSSAIWNVTQYWTVLERNTLSIPLEEALLYNRAFWLLIGLAVLWRGYLAFDFTVLKDRLNRKKKVQEPSDEIIENVIIPRFALRERFEDKVIQLRIHSIFYFKSIIREVAFWSIVLSGMLIIFMNSINVGTVYGVNSYPTTYLIVEELKEMSVFFFLMILVFYSGELIWKERDAKLNLIYDALPVSDFTNLASKFIGLMLTYIILLAALIVSGVIFQTVNGYYQYELGLYCTGLFLDFFPSLILYSLISFFIQVMVNSKFLGHMLVMLFAMLTVVLQLFGIDHMLYSFGGSNLGIYSDMNGYGHFLEPYVWSKLYWLAFCMLCFVVATIFVARGTETGLNTRWELAKERFGKSLQKLAVASMVVFILIGSYIFYNTNILNSYWLESSELGFRADYELTLKKFEYIAQPKVVDVKLNVELYPEQRNYTAEGYFILNNTENEPIEYIHVQKLVGDNITLDYVEFEGGAVMDNTYAAFDYHIYKLHSPLQSGDSIKMLFKQSFTSKGFVSGAPNTNIVQNGTFFRNDDFPTFGYNKKYELRSDADRADYGLAPRMNKAKRNHPHELKLSRTGEDGSKINFEIVIGTDANQIAIAPGTLQGEWSEKSRKYYHYKMDAPMVNFYSIVSARYEVRKEVWTPENDSLASPIDLEIYYNKGHEYNLDRMMKSMQASFDYFNSNFTPYPYQQMRIMEFPRYGEFAQSFPTTVPFSESIGFVLDIDDEQDVDMAFFVTTHELAHQWWGLQVVSANVQGRYTISETLAQYSALMVLKQGFPENKVQQFIDSNMDLYFDKRALDSKAELPLTLTDKRYAYYRKGVVNMYAFQDYISEDSVNLALRRFINDWNPFSNPNPKGRFATTNDLISYFRAVTPDSLQYIITDLFETVTIYNNKITAATYEALENNIYKVKLSLDAEKYRVDSLGMEVPIGINDWIDIGIYTKGLHGNDSLIYLKKHKITEQNTELEILVNQVPSKAGIDVKHMLMDRNVGDNVREMD